MLVNQEPKFIRALHLEDFDLIYEGQEGNKD
jgi:hypothetical protein